MTKYPAVDRAIAELRIWNAVAIVGAGTSVEAGFPLRDLQPLLWMALDSDIPARDALARKLGQQPMPAKDLIGDDYNSALTRQALQVIETSQIARRTYQRGFAELDTQRSLNPSNTHRALARLLHRRVIEVIISLNWDTQLEAAYHLEYGSSLIPDGNWLYKPHGDAGKPDIDWILPHQPGFVSPHLLSHVNRLVTERPRTLLVVGYSDRDETIVKVLTGPLSHRWRVIRIGPTASGELDIPLSASKALRPLADSLCPRPEVPGWEYVSFDDQHDLGPALDGHQLGPKDVMACPRLPEVQALKRHVDVANKAVLVGKSGSGKSVTAYQTAYDLHLDGWEVLRLESPITRPANDLVTAVQALPRRSVLVIDDAQAVDPRLPRLLLETASVSRAVLIISSSERDVLSGIVALDGPTSVATLAKVCHERSSELLPFVKQLDPEIGEGFFDEPLDRRISQAAKSQIAWQFFYVLTGGEKRVRDVFAIFRDADRADLLLGVIAACQFLSRDGGGASPKRLNQLAIALQKDAAWARRSLQVLKKQRTVVGEGSVRCSHMKLAEVALRIISRDKNDPEWSHFIEVLRSLLASEQTELAGIPWLLNSLRLNGAFDYNRFDTVVNQDTWEKVTHRCWKASDSAARSGALLTLDALDYWYKNLGEAIEEHSELLGKWLEETDDITTGAMGWILNHIGRKPPSNNKSLYRYADPAVLARFFNQMNWTNASGRAWLLQRLAACAPVSWNVRLQSSLDLNAIGNLVHNITEADVYTLSEVLKAIPYGRANFRLTLFEESIPVLASAFNRDPVESYRETDDMFWHTLGFYPGFLRVRPPTPRQRELAQRFATTLEPEMLAVALSNSRQRDWETVADFLFFLREAAPSVAQRVANLIDFTRLDKPAEGLWRNPPHEMLNLIGALAIGPDMEPSSKWISRHAMDLSEMSTLLAAVAPKVIAERLQAGDILIIDDKEWQYGAFGLAQLASINIEVAKAVADASKVQLAHDFENLQKYHCEYVQHLVMVLGKVAPSVLDEIFASMDVTNAEQHWDELLRGTRQEQKAVVALLNATETMPEPMAALITQLRKRYPRATSPVGSPSVDVP